MSEPLQDVIDRVKANSATVEDLRTLAMAYIDGTKPKDQVAETNMPDPRTPEDKAADEVVEDAEHAEAVHAAEVKPAKAKKK